MNFHWLKAWAVNSDVKWNNALIQNGWKHPSKLHIYVIRSAIEYPISEFSIRLMWLKDRTMISEYLMIKVTNVDPANSWNVIACF